jgi:hypothetical protein
MRTVLYLLACAACTPPPPASAPVKPSGPPYLSLFQLDRAWSLPAEVSNGHKDGTGFIADHTARGFVACKVNSVRTVGEAQVARLTCEPPLSDVLVAGTWVSTQAGLFHPAIPLDDADDLASLDDMDLMIAATPAERHQAHTVAEARVTSEAFEFGAGWCVRDRTAAADARRGYTLCFDASGVTGGDDVVMMGSLWRRSRFGQVPPPDADDPISQ